MNRQLLAEYLRRFGTPELPFDSLENLLTSPDGFGLETATPLQRATCRLIDGIPLGDLAGHPHIMQAMGDVSHLEGLRPRKIILLAGIRTGKSLMAAALIAWAAMKVEVRHLGRGEVPRHSTISTEKDLAKVILGHLVSGLMASEKLRPMLVGEPTQEGCFLTMPDGHVMEARIVAGAKAGKSVIARWSAGFTADEAPRMAGASESVINLEDTETAVEGRLLPGAQIFNIGSPWAPFGPVYEQAIEHEGKPSEDVVVIRARGDWLNPYWWTTERAEKLRKRNPTAYQTDFLAQFADLEETLYTQALLDDCTRSGPVQIPFEQGHDYAAAIDPATRGNAWTLVVADRVGRKKRIVYAQQWIGSSLEPLRPKVVLAQIAGILEEYQMDWCYTDQWSADALVDIAEDKGVDLIIEDWTSHGKTVAYGGLRDSMAELEVDLPRDVELLRDLRMVKRRVTRTGVAIELPHTGDGRHCDYAPPTVRALTRWIEEDEEQPPIQGTKERANWDAEQRQNKAADILDEQETRPWWDKGPETT